jgi:hypothetical protein
VYILHAVEEKPENYHTEVSWDFPFKGREAVKQKCLHGGTGRGIAKLYLLQ